MPEPIVTPPAEKAPLAERLAARTLALVEVPSESRAEAALAAQALAVLREGGVAARDAGDTCVLAGTTARGARPFVLLLGHLDTVPAQGNLPGRRIAGRVEGLGAADMKGGVAVMLELALAALPASVDVGFVLFGREELPSAEGALVPLLEREPGLRTADLAIVLEPTANVVQAGCLGNLDATWTFHGRSGHSARPWLADNAIERAARGIATLAELELPPVVHAGLAYRPVVAVTGIEGGIAKNVIPGSASANVNFRYDASLSPDQAEALLRGWCEPHGTVDVTGCTPGALPPHGNALAATLAALSGAPMEPKQAWTPVAELAAAGVDAVNFGPGDPAFAHRADEAVAVEALVRCHDVLAGFLCA
jgi:succinyl-diaminopimelate desuccinylase